MAGVLELDNKWPNFAPLRWITYFNIATLERAVARTVEFGGPSIVGPVAGPHGPLHLVKAPGGHTVCLIQLEDGLRPDYVSSPAVTRYDRAVVRLQTSVGTGLSQSR